MKKDEIDKYIIKMFKRKVIQKRLASGKDFRWIIRFKDGLGVAIEYQSYKKVSLIDVFHKEMPYYLRYKQKLKMNEIKDMERMLKLKSILEKDF